MNKWETIYTEVLVAMVANSKEDLIEVFLNGQFQAHADCMTTIARQITQSAIKEMQLNN